MEKGGLPDRPLAGAVSNKRQKLLGKERKKKGDREHQRSVTLPRMVRQMSGQVGETGQKGTGTQRQMNRVGRMGLQKKGRGASKRA